MAFRKNLILTLQPRNVQVLKNQHTAWAQKAGSSQIIGLHVALVALTVFVHLERTSPTPVAQAPLAEAAQLFVLRPW